MRRFKLNLPAGQLVPLTVRGDYLRVISGSAEFQIQPDTSHSLSGMQSGMAYTTDKTFNELKLTSDVTQDVEIMAGLGRVDDNRSSISGTVDTASKGATVASSGETVGTSAVEILAADVQRRGVIIQNLDSAANIYIGGSGVTTGSGLKVEPSGFLVLDKAPQGAIYAIATAAGVDVRVLTESD